MKSGEQLRRVFRGSGSSCGDLCVYVSSVAGRWRRRGTVVQCDRRARLKMCRYRALLYFFESRGSVVFTIITVTFSVDNFSKKSDFPSSKRTPVLYVTALYSI